MRSLALSFAAVLAVAAAGAEAADGARRGLGFGKPPSWVKPVAVDRRASPEASEISGGVHYLLLDLQTRVGPRGEERYRHYAKRLVNEAGLDASSQLSVTYDPGYETLELHDLHLLRGGAVLDRLARGQIELVQREKALDAQIYDGALSAVLFIEDLRVGDVVEYAYTLRGANPVLENRYTDAFDVEWTVPLRRFRFRFLWPGGRTLLVRNHGTSIAPVVRRIASGREYVWELEEPAPVDDPGDVPAWYPSWAWVQLTEFPSWADVTEWARPLYRLPPVLPPALAAQVEDWKRLPDQSARALAALRFVQDEVRYVGIELGAGSHRPTPPESVFSRRFGDCKDKSLLLTTLLEAFGVSARPALVNTRAGRGLDDWLPTPYAFNHVVTRVELDGRVLWLDPTRTAQGGTLEDTYFPDYERALVVDEGIDTLTEIPLVAPSRPTETVSEEFRVGDDADPVEYDVDTRYEGPDADRLRYDLRRRSREDVAEGYLDFYAGSWTGIRARAPLEITDDREGNVLVTRERYAIPSFWGEGDSPGRRRSELWASTLTDILRRPEVASHAPLAVAHPLFIRHSTRVRLPGDWGIQPDEAQLRTPAVLFSYRAEPAGDTLLLDYEYRTVKDSVSASAVEDHLARLDEMWNRLEFGLERPTGGRLGGTNWTALVTLALSGALGGLGGVILVRREGAPPRRVAARRGRVLLALVVAGAAAVQALALWRAWLLCRPASWSLRTLSDGTLHHPLWEPLLLALLATGVLLLAWAGALLVLLARGRGRARQAYVAWAFTQTGVLFGAAALLAALPGARGSVLEPALRDALLSLVALVPGTMLALSRSWGPVTSRPSLPRP